MSAENGKVCCNCRHNIRIDDEKYGVRCYCEIKEKYMGYLEVMDGWCKRWAKDKTWEVNADE